MSPNKEYRRLERNSGFHSWKLVEDNMPTEKAELFKAIRAKLEQSWHIVMNDSCCRRAHVLADIQREITKMFCEMEQTITE
jgi:hypothetical protein